MKYNLTDQQKELARWIVDEVCEGNLNETFYVMDSEDGNLVFRSGDERTNSIEGDIGMLLALRNSQLLLMPEAPVDTFTRCVTTGELFNAVKINFAEEPEVAPVSTLAQPHPPEIAMPLDRLRTKFPDPKKLGFLVMRFAAAKPFDNIVKVIKATAEKHGLDVIRADEHEFHADLWGNVRTCLHGCGFGIAVYERIQTDEPNANVGLEVGYLMAMNKPVLLLKDKTLTTIQSDLAGKLYKEFDPHAPEATIPPLLEKWLKDYGIVVEGH